MADNRFRILCISPLFTPRADAEAFCGAKLALELLKRGIDLTVLALDPNKPKQCACDDSKLWEPLKNITHNIATPVEKNRFYSAYVAIRYRTLSYARWIAAVIEKAETLYQKKAFDLVYSRSLPMEAHIAGYWAAKRFKIPWLVNMNDPWDWHVTVDELRQKYPLHFGLISTCWMKKTLASASLITYPSLRLRNHHVRICGIEHASQIIPHIGYSAETVPEDKSLFRMVHAGRLGGWEKRHPHALLQGVHLFLKKFPEARRSFRMLFVGPEDENTHDAAAQLGMQSMVESTGRVSYQRSLEYIQSAAVCVVVEGKLKEGIFLPSKLADYIAARKPVLALSPNIGVLSDMARQQGITQVGVDDVEGIASALGTYYDSYRNGRMAALAPSSKLIGTFLPDTVTAQFLEHAHSVLKDRATSRTARPAVAD